jgi:hypothetical protein
MLLLFFLIYIEAKISTDDHGHVMLMKTSFISNRFYMTATLRRSSSFRYNIYISKAYMAGLHKVLVSPISVGFREECIQYTLKDLLVWLLQDVTNRRNFWVIEV